MKNHDVYVPYADFDDLKRGPKGGEIHIYFAYHETYYRACNETMNWWLSDKNKNDERLGKVRLYWIDIGQYMQDPETAKAWRDFLKPPGGVPFVLLVWDQNGERMELRYSVKKFMDSVTFSVHKFIVQNLTKR